MQPTGLVGARKRSWASGAATACIAAASAPAVGQIIQPDYQPAVTIDNFANAARPQSQRQGLVVFGDVFTSLERNSNALSLSNLPCGLELPAVADTKWLKGISAGVGNQLSEGATVFVRAEAAHTTYFDSDFLSFGQFTGPAGVSLRIPRGLSMMGAVSCTSQRDGKSLGLFQTWGSRGAGQFGEDKV